MSNLPKFKKGDFLKDRHITRRQGVVEAVFSYPLVDGTNEIRYDIRVDGVLERGIHEWNFEKG